MTVNPDRIGQLTDELLELEPSLRPEREQVERLVRSLAAATPSVEPRAGFEAELLGKLKQKMNTETVIAPTFSFLSLFNPMDTRFIFGGAGAVLGALAVAIVLQQQALLPEQSADVDQDGEQIAFESGITDVGPMAFGSLAVVQEAAQVPTPAGIEADVPDTANARSQSGGGGGMNYGVDSKMIAPAGDITFANYVYSGALTLPTEDVQVYRRVRPTSQPGSQNAITGFAEDMLNWQSLGGLKLQSVSLMGAPDGYSAYIDYMDGSLSVNRMYTADTNPNMRCADPDCYERNRLREADMISDEQSFSIARAFVEQLGIDMSSYGEPIVMDDWRIWYNQTENKADYYFPEQMNVVFPLMIDGQMVYEEYGQPFGLSVSIDVRSKTAAGMYNYYVQRYESSAYAPVTDEAKMRAAIARGGSYRWEGPEVKEVEVQIGAPTMGLMRKYLWNDGDMQGQDLFVPALIFPVENQPEGLFDSRTRVIVPLADELINTDPAVMPLIMEDMMRDEPVAEPAAEEAAAG